MSGPASVRHVTAGPAALAAMSKRLGLEPQGWRVEGLCVEGGERARLCLTKGEYRFVFYLHEEPGRIGRRGAGAGLRAQGEAGPAQSRLLGLLSKRLSGLRLGELAAGLEADRESFVEELALGSTGDRLRVPYVAGPIGLSEAGWRNFFADQDFEILMEAPEPTPNKTITIEYADLECFCARPDVSFAQWSFLDWPDESVDIGPGGDDAFVALELEERDMVLGTGDKADALVSEVRRLADAGNYMVVTHLCTPIVMGEDFSGLARRCEKEVGATSVSWSQKDRDRKDNFGEHFRALLGRPGFFDGPGDADAVNLFHFPVAFRERELRPFLEELGLKVNVRAFPVVDFPSLEAIPRARWQVFCEKPSYADRTLELMRGSGRPVVLARAPYGVEGTRECLRGIAAAAGRQREFESAWARRLETGLPGWEAGRREAAGYRLAFVVSEASLPRLLELRYGHGAPPARVLAEMGFGIDLLYYDRHGDPPRLPQELQGARTAVFRSPSELALRLREGEFRAVYSDIFFDWRITAAGKSRFSSRDLEMGLGGATRSLDRLLNACRLPFYRRYSAHLGRRPRSVNV